MDAEPRIAVFGAGAIGCWVGGRLAHGGADVTLIGRARVMDELANGLHVTDLHGDEAMVRPRATTDAAAAAGCDAVLVTVKSAQTAEAGATLAKHLPDGALVISLQNGVRNADVLREALPGRVVLAAMVPFNVVRKAAVLRGRRVEAGAYHRASSGALRVEQHAAFTGALRTAFEAARLPVELRDDMPAVQWAKLVMNLNNAINALSGMPLSAELAQRPFRRCLAGAQREALELLVIAKQDVARLTALPPHWMPRLLDVPDRLFKLLASRVVAIDPHARSSMWDDLEAKRPTEIAYLQGEVVELGERLGRAAPVNRTLQRLVRDAEGGGKRDFRGDELLAAVGLA